MAVILLEIIIAFTKGIKIENQRLGLIFIIASVIGISWGMILDKVSFIGSSGIKQIIHKFHVDIALLAMVFLVLGMITREFQVLHRLTKRKTVPSFFLSFIILVFLTITTNCEVELSRNQIVSPIMFYFISFVGIIFVVSGAYLVCTYALGIKKLLIFYGENSLHIMAIHCVFFRITDLVYVALTNETMDSIINFPVAFPELRICYVVVSIVGSGVFVLCKNKIYSCITSNRKR